jgi:hypothetical protein
MLHRIAKVLLWHYDTQHNGRVIMLSVVAPLLCVAPLGSPHRLNYEYLDLPGKTRNRQML